MGGEETYGDLSIKGQGVVEVLRIRGREGREGPGSPKGGQWGRHLQQQLNNVHVHQPQDRLPIDVGDEVSSSQARLLGGAPLLHALRGNGGVSRMLQQQETPASCCLSCCLFS